MVEQRERSSFYGRQSYVVITAMAIFAIIVTIVGYYVAVECAKKTTVWTVLRFGFVINVSNPSALVARI